MIGRRNAKGQQTWWIMMLVSTGFLWPAGAGDTTSADKTQAIHAVAIRIVDQYGRQPPTGKRDIGSEIFDVTVGPVGNEFSFVPNTVNIAVGDTVRWTWASDEHSVTSGTSCTADGQFCSPDNMNCDVKNLNNTGFVYEFTFTQPGMYQYFCDLHCEIGMTGVVNVIPARTHPTPRPRPTAGPRPTS